MVLRRLRLSTQSWFDTHFGCKHN